MAYITTYTKRKEAGVCPDCGEEKDREGFYCKACLEKRNAYQRENKKFYRESHLCSVCGKEFVYAKDKRCFDCREKARKRKPPTEEQKKRWQQNFYSKQKSLYQERVSKGICTKCGKVRAVTGKKKCGACLEKEARAQRKRHESQNVREYRKMNNLCYFCGKPIDRDSGRICKACWQRCSEHRNKDSGRKNEFWDLDNKIAFKNYN